MVKRCLVVVGVTVLILGGVIVIRTLMFASRQIAVEPVPPLEVNTADAVGRMSRALTFKTISHQEPSEFDAAAFSDFHDFLAQSFPEVHNRLKLETVGDFSLLYTWAGSDPSLAPVLLLAHMDVAPVAPGTEAAWQHPPFSGEVADGFIWGRGALDDKASLMATLEAVEMLLAEGGQPKRTVYLAFGHDEEVGGEYGAVNMAALLKSRGVQAEFVLDEGAAVVEGVLPGLTRPVGIIGIAEKGYVSVELVVHAEGGHSSQPPRETAIGILATAISRLEANQMPADIVGPAREMFMRVGPEMGFGMRAVLANLWLFAPLVKSQLAGSPEMNAMLRTTTAPTILEAGIKENVLPAQARGVVNFRILPGDTIDGVLDHVGKVVDDSRVEIRVIRDSGREPSTVSPVSGAPYQLVERTIRELVGEAVVAPTLVLGGTDSRYYGELTDNILRFAPLWLNSEDLKRIHGTNERIAVENYALMIRFYHQLIENAAL